MPRRNLPIVYWDSSAILSAIFKDKHSAEVQRWTRREGIHLMSTLAYTEACAVIARIQREHVLADVLVHAAVEVLEKGPWYRLNTLPEWKSIQPLSVKWSLRGADLWHLATAKSLLKQLPELFLLTFDNRLRVAAQGEGMIKKLS